ncbi:MAG: Blp family class II bacteriocin [Lachnospiraceae bacterium]|nr:Blp family class II bacteriocin [Lachnospiraceae bacterium]
MTDMKKMNEQELENVTGGESRIVNTGKNIEAVVRSGAGFGFPQIFAIKNGNFVNTTGRSVRADGRTWYEVNAPVYGWMAGSLIGLADRY